MNTQKTKFFVKAFLFWAIFQTLLFSCQFLLSELPRWALGISYGGSIVVALLILTHVFLKFDELTWADLGMVPGLRSLKRFFLSLLVGMALFGSFFLVYLALSPVEIRSVNADSVFNVLVISFFVFLVLGAMEEIAFRGYFLRKLETAIGLRFAIYVTSVLFGLYHGLTVDSLTGPAVWGLIYGTLAYWSKGLAIPIGFHAGVNLVQALLGQKEKWAGGLWTFDLTDEAALLTVDQVTIGLQVVMLIASVLFMETYIARRKKAELE